jgi:hypothetical protein
MQVQELTKKIHDDFPKVWEKLNKYYSNKILDDYFDYQIFRGDFEIYCETGCCHTGYEMTIPFSMLYGLLDEFFRKYDIILHLLLSRIISDYVLENCITELREKYEEFQQQVIFQACEIMEGKL